MPVEVTNTAAPAGTTYQDIRFGLCSIHQKKVAAAGMAASRDADLRLPIGLPINAAGGPVTAGDAVGLVGPETVRLGAVDIFANAIVAGPVSQQAIESNLGRVLTNAEKAGIKSGLPGIVLL
jgi:hypothetical protein